MLLPISTAVLKAPREVVQVMARRGECGGILVAIDRVGGEQTAEKHDLLGPGTPTSRACDFLLLLDGLELVREVSRVVRQFSSPSSRSRRPPR